MAHGGDGGGSIRIPAACCGVFGLKPSRGRLPVGPDATEYWFGFVNEHAITRSVRDSAALLDATAGPDVTAPYVARENPRPFLDEVGLPPGRLRIAFNTRPFLPGVVEDTCKEAVAHAAKLCEELGHHVAEAAPVIDPRDFAKIFFTLVCCETAADIREAERRLGRKAVAGTYETSTFIAAMLGRRFSGEDLCVARARLAEIGRRAARFFEQWDVLLTPTLGKAPVPLGTLKPTGLEAVAQGVIAERNLGSILRFLPIEKIVDRLYEFIPFTPLANVSGQPSMNVPLFWNREGLPIGTMFTAAVGAEATLLRLAAQLEQAQPWADRRRRPPVHAF
jgi:amidase